MLKLYVLITDGGDGSYSPEFCIDPEAIAFLQKLYDDDKMDYESGIGVDGDGFHYSTINVPDGSTAESLGVMLLTLEDAKEYDTEDEDDA